MTKWTAWILLGFLAMVIAFAPIPARPVTPQTRTFEIDARQFAYSPSELKVNAGDTVTIQLVSTDVVHGLYVDGYTDNGHKVTLSNVWNLRVNKLASSCLYSPSVLAIQPTIACLKSVNIS